MNKDKNKSVIAVGLLFIILATISIIVVLIRSGRFDFFSFADTAMTPKNVEITNITNTGFDLYWFTIKDTIGGIKFSGENNVLYENDKETMHYLAVGNLRDNQEPTFTIFSEGSEYPVQYVVTLADKDLSGEKIIKISGRVVGNISNGFVTIQFSNSKGEKSQLLAAMIATDGTYAIDVNRVLTQDLTEKMDIKGLINMDYKIYQSSDDMPVLKTMIFNIDNVTSLPDIYL